MDKIKEVMGLLDQYAWEYRASNEEKTSGARFLAASNAAFARKAMESKLRELLEREPLSEDRIETLFMSTELECMSSDDIEDAIAFARLIEADHGICNDSKGM